MITDSYGRIIEATEEEMFGAYLNNHWDDVMSFTDFLDKVSVNGTKIIKEGEGQSRRMSKETPITEQIRKLTEEMCDKYCKYPALYESEFKDVDEAMCRMTDEVCEKCPLMKL